MPDCGNHTLSPADSPLTWARSRTEPGGKRSPGSAEGRMRREPGSGAQKPGSGEEGELAGRGTQGLAVFLGERLAAGSLEGGGDVVPGTRERGTQQPGENPPHQGQGSRVRGGRPGQV